METLGSFTKGMETGLKEQMSGKRAKSKKRKGTGKKSKR